jgi:hypothetical protein
VKKNVVHEFSQRIAPYAYFLSAVFAHDPQQAWRDSEYFNKDWDTPFLARYCAGLDGHWSGCLFLPTKIDARVIVHEVFHVTHRLMERMGHEIVRGNDEPHAYLIDELFSIVVAEAKKGGIRISLK